MFVKPAHGLKVRDPITKRHLPDEGREVPTSTYWVRRLACGDVALATKPEEVVTDIQITDSQETR